MSNQINFANKVVFLSGLPLTLPTATTDPGTGIAGDLYYNTVSNTVRYYNGTAWSNIQGGSLTGYSLNNNNIIVGNSSNISTALDTNGTGDILADAVAGLTVEKIQGNTVFGVTGTGNVVFATGPTFTGTVNGATAIWSTSVSAPQFISTSANPASSGVLNLANSDAIAWRNNANTADITLAKDTSDQLRYNSNPIFTSAGILTTAAFPALTGDVTNTAGTVATTISANAVTYAKFQQVAASSLIGNPTGSPANAEGITLGSTLTFSGTVLETGALTGDVTSSANSFATTIAANAVSYAKFQQVAANSLIGNPTGTLANAEAITLGTTLVFSAGSLETSAFTGDVTTSANSFATTIAANAVTYAKFQQVAADSLVGNPTGSLANAEGITLGATLTFSGTALQTTALTGDVTSSANSFATTISANAVTYAKFQQVAADSLVGNPTASLANAEGITLGTTLTFSSGSLITQALTGDVTSSANSFATTIAANAVTYAKFQQVAADSLVGNPTGSLANAEGITLGATLSFVGTALETNALTSDVTSSANSFVTTVSAIHGTTVSGTTGTGNVVFSNSPTLTGTTLASAMTLSGLFTVSLTAGTAVQTAAFLTPSMSNGQQNFLSIGTANSSGNAFTMAYQYNSSAASSWLSFQPWSFTLGNGLSINGDGAVGIGGPNTSTNSGDLLMSGNLVITGSTGITLNNGVAVNWGGSTNLIYGSNASNYVRIRTNGTDAFFVNSSQAVSTKNNTLDDGSGNAVFAGTVTAATGSTILGTGTTQLNITSSSTGGGRAITFGSNNGSPTFYNWLIGAQFNVSNAFEITPSTTVGGSTYTTPVFQISQTGNTTITGTFTSTASGGSTFGPTTAGTQAFIKINGDTATTGDGPFLQFANRGTAIFNIGSYSAIASTTGTDSALSATGNMYLFSGSTQALRLDTNQNVLVGTTALSTSASNGFLYLPTCAGAPTGTPTSYTGLSPVIVDSTDGKFYFYSGGAWNTPSGGGGGGSNWPTQFATSEATLTTAIAACASSGGIICISGSFSISSAHTLPAYTMLVGQMGASLLTIAAGGSLTMGDECIVQDLYVTSPITGGTLFTVSGNRCTFNNCKITVPGSSSTTVAIGVTGSATLINRCLFAGVANGSTGVGILYLSGTSNVDQNCVFLT